LFLHRTAIKTNSRFAQQLVAKILSELSSADKGGSHPACAINKRGIKIHQNHLPLKNTRRIGIDEHATALEELATGNERKEKVAEPVATALRTLAVDGTQVAKVTERMATALQETEKILVNVATSSGETQTTS
jgi:hypothetical protein